MNKKALVHNLLMIIISIGLCLFSAPVCASDGNLVFVFFYTFIAYPFILFLGFIAHIHFIVSKAYTNRNRLIVALIVIGAMALAGASLAQYIIENSVFAIMVFLLFWVILSAIPLWQYWNHVRYVGADHDWRVSFKWMVLISVVFYFVLGCFLFRPMVNHYQTTRHHEKRVQNEARQSEKQKKEKQEREQVLSEKRQKSQVAMKQRQEQRVQKHQEHYMRLLETVLIKRPAEILTLKAMTSSEIKQQADDGPLPRSMDGYFVDQSQILSDSKIEELKALLRNPSLYDFEYKGVINPFIRDSQRVTTVLFGGGAAPLRIVFYRDKSQITIVDSFDVASVKLSEPDKLDQYFSEK